jgi:hypothetical protein
LRYSSRSLISFSTCSFSSLPAIFCTTWSQI